MVIFMIVRVNFVNHNGPLADALGVSKDLSDELDTYVTYLITEGLSIIEIIQHVQSEFDLNINELASFFYALGYYIAKTGN